jgi:HD-GYP domain-containing protein (c-di-GMP phosphodiesterase class II)
MTYHELIAAIARLRDDATKLEPAIQKHAAAAAATDAGLHAHLHRMELAVGELRAVLATLRERAPMESRQASSARMTAANRNIDTVCDPANAPSIRKPNGYRHSSNTATMATKIGRNLGGARR